MSEKPPKPSKRPNAPVLRTRKGAGARLSPGASRGDGGASERPTLNPPFDLEAYARQASGPSVRPHVSPDMPTSRPAPLPALPHFGGESSSETASDEDTSQWSTDRITLTNEVDLERARVQSAAAAAPARRSGASSALSIANARVASAPTLDSDVDDLLDEGRDGQRPGGATDASSQSSIEAAVLGAIGASAAPPEITERTIDDPLAEMRERFSLGDYSGALEMSELILAELPDDPEVTECAASCRTVLENMYAARLGPLDRVPIVIVPRTQMRWLSMDHRAGFILSLIDGSSSIDMILDLCGMPRLDAYRILQDLVQQKIVSFR